MSIRKWFFFIEGFPNLEGTSVDNLLVRNIIIEDGTSTMQCSQMSIGFFQERVGGFYFVKKIKY